MAEFSFTSELEDTYVTYVSVTKDIEKYVVKAFYEGIDELIAYLNINDVEGKGNLDHVYFHFPSEASAVEVAELIAEDENIADKILLTYLNNDSPGTERWAKETVDATELESIDDLRRMDCSVFAEDARYNLSYGNKDNGSWVSDESYSVFCMSGSDIEEVEKDIARYVEELHMDTEVASNAEELVSESLKELSELTARI